MRTRRSRHHKWGGRCFKKKKKKHFLFQSVPRAAPSVKLPETLKAQPRRANCVCAANQTTELLLNSQRGNLSVLETQRLKRFSLSLLLVQIKCWRKLSVDTMISLRVSVCVCCVCALACLTHNGSLLPLDGTVRPVCICVSVGKERVTQAYYTATPSPGTEVINNTVDYISLWL